MFSVRSIDAKINIYSKLFQNVRFLSHMFCTQMLFFKCILYKLFKEKKIIYCVQIINFACKDLCVTRGARILLRFLFRILILTGRLYILGNPNFWGEKSWVLRKIFCQFSDIRKKVVSPYRKKVFSCQVLGKMSVLR